MRTKKNGNKAKLGGFLICIFFALCGASGGAVIIDQIGVVGAYNVSAEETPNASQIFTDFPTYGAMSLSGFTVTADQLNIRTVEVLMRAQNGFASFQALDGYRVSIFSSPNQAGSGLLGDVATRFVDLTSLVNVFNIGSNGEALVQLGLNMSLPSAGNYWVGVAPVGSFTVAGQFYVMNQGSTDSSAEGYFVNPEEGFGMGTVTELDLDFAYRLSTTPVPEPGTTFLMMASLAIFLRRKKQE